MLKKYEIYDKIYEKGKTMFLWKFIFITFIKSVNYINCNIIEFLINKVLDVKSLVSFIIKILPIV